MSRMIWLVGAVALLFGLSACGSDTVSEAPLKMPKKEQTWVKTESVELTKTAALDKSRQLSTLEMPIDNALLGRLTKAATSSAVKDQKSCMDTLEPLDKKRTAIQKAGGLWHAFERTALVRPYSNNGMQLDSNLNKLVFALRYLCNNASGMPMEPVGAVVNHYLDKQGKEATRDELISWGEAPKVADQWIDYAERTKKDARRTIDYSTIGNLIAQATPSILLYEELHHRELSEENKDVFLSEAVTLLAAVKTMIQDYPNLALALNEDQSIPYEEFRGEM